jgi:hypothetical protein
MGLFDTVKKILFDEDEIDDSLPVRNDKKEDKDKHDDGGIIFHNNEEDTITEVKVPEEKPTSLVFPVRVDDTDEHDLRALQERLEEDEMNRTQNIEKVQENLTRSKSDLVNEYNETRRLQRETDSFRREEPVRRVEPQRRVETPIRHDEPVRKEVTFEEKKVPYKVPPVISPVFGVLDKNYDPDNYEETRHKITMTNAGNTSDASERQFGPVSYNDQGIPLPKYHKETTIIITNNNPSKELHEELKREAEAKKEAEQIEESIINSIINDEVKTDKILDDTREHSLEETVEVPKKEVEQEIEEPTVEFQEPIEDDNDAVIEGSPYDDMLDEVESPEPSVDINELINSSNEEEANVPIDEPTDTDENVNLDDTIETDLYNLIDSMYSDED